MALINALNSFTCAYPQSEHYEKVYTTENGLPHNHVLSIAFDKTGFLWVGTWDGLSRFDGYEFHNYHHDPDDPLSIPYFICRKICVDRYNNVWVFHLGNVLSKYQRNTDNFKNYSVGYNPVLKLTGIVNIETDPEGNLLICGNNRIAIYDSATDGFKNIPVRGFENILPSLGEIGQITFDNLGSVWITTNEYFLEGQLNKSGIDITSSYPRIEGDFIPVPNSFNQIYKILTLDDNTHWMLSNTGVSKIPADSKAFDLPGEFKSGNAISYCYKKDNQIILIADNERISIELQAGGFPQALLKDPSGTIWYSTIYSSGMGSGLHRYNKTPGYFSHYLSEVNGMPSSIHTIAKDDQGNLLVGAEAANYISCINENGEITRLNPFTDEEALSYIHLRCLLPVENGIFVGYMKRRLDFFDYSTRRFLNLCLTDDPSRMKEPFGFRTLLKYPGGDLLIGSIGVFRLTPGNGKFKKIWQTNPPEKDIYCMIADSRGYVWAGSGSDLIKITDKYQVDTIYSISNAVYNIEDICFDNDSNMWLALLGGGLLLFDPETGKRDFYTTADGLSNNTTYSILKDKHNNLWITTDNGISRFNTDTRSFRIFGSTDGLEIHEFNSDAAYLDKEGRMYFGGMGGVVSFHPDSIVDSETEQKLYPLLITEFKVSGIPRFFEEPVYEAKRITLNKGDDNIGIAFACPDFKNAEKINYRYRLIGYNKEWNETDHLHRRINFAGLNPGTYELEIQSTDISGNWSNNLNLQIKIPPHFYQTVAFSLTLIILIISVTGFLIVLYNRQIRIKEGQKQQYLKLESIRGQMNPHFIFNSLNSINYFIANNDRLAANRYISNFSKLIRSFLFNMSQDYISLTDELASLEDYLKLEFLRFGDKFDYSVNSQKIRLPDMWEVFPGMVQPFVENAIWHGVRGLQDRKGLINVVFSSVENSGILCTITDDGIGRRLSARSGGYSEKKKSRGIQLILERMHLINHLENKNYSVKIEDLYPEMEECGTQITIEIPSRMKKN